MELPSSSNGVDDASTDAGSVYETSFYSAEQYLLAGEVLLNLNFTFIKLNTPDTYNRCCTL